MNKFQKSLKAQSFLLLLISGGMALLLFLILNVIGTRVLDEYFHKTSYNERADKRCIEKFEKFVKENEIKTTDKDKLREWAIMDNKGYVVIALLKHDKVLFNSLYEYEEMPITGYLEAGVKKKIAFADTTAMVYLNGYFNYQFYMYAVIGEIILSVALFMGICIGYIQKKIRYVLQLEKEIKILETGDLNYAITVEGQDELASLADGLNQMRIKLRENIQIEEAAVKANYDLVVSIAHDLRTPLTALLLYLDLICKDENTDSEKIRTYTEKSRMKAVQIKTMSEQLFERFLLSSDDKVELEESKKAQYIFDDMLSDMAGYLTENGFEVEGSMDWQNVSVQIVQDYIGRICDNIASNIIKYGERTKPVKISVVRQDKWLILLFMNSVKEDEEQKGTGVGVQNIRMMMEKMNGVCQIHQSEQNYIVELRFKI